MTLVSATTSTSDFPPEGATPRRDQVLEDLRASEQRLAAIIENSPGVAVQVYDRAGRVLEWNRASETMFGFSREHAVGRTLDQLIHTVEATDAFVATLASIASSGLSVGPSEHEFTRLDGSHGVCLSTLFAIPGSPGEQHFVCMDVDVTALHQSNAALRETRSRFEAIFHQTFQFIGLLDTAGTLLEANRSALEFAGLKEADVIGRPFWETTWWAHLPEQQQRLRDAIARAATGEFVRFEAMHRRPDGVLAHVDFSLKPVRGEDGRVVLLIPQRPRHHRPQARRSRGRAPRRPLPCHRRGHVRRSLRVGRRHADHMAQRLLPALGGHGGRKRRPLQLVA